MAGFVQGDVTGIAHRNDSFKFCPAVAPHRHRPLPAGHLFSPLLRSGIAVQHCFASLTIDQKNDENPTLPPAIS
jgi:hypothetical protein